MMGLTTCRTAGSGLTNLTAIEAGVLSYEHAEPPVDGVYTRNALHHLPDFWKAMALRRMAEMLRPGGILRLHALIYDFQPSEAEDVFGPWLDGAASDPTAGYTCEDYATHIRTEHSTFRWLFEPVLTAVGLEIVTVDFVRSLYGAYTCVRR
jgi:SAM-dependent methyltransferase